MAADTIAVLLVEDNPGDARLIREMIREVPDFVCRLDHVDRLSAAVASLQYNQPDAVLLDLSLPDSTGLATFTALQDAAPALPIVVLTGLNDQTVALQAVQAGAQDYLVKGEVQGTLLVRSLRYAIERKHLLQELETERAWLQTVIQHSPAGILLVEGPRGERVVANARAEELFGCRLPPEQGIGPWVEYLCDAGGKPVPYDQTAIARALRGELTPLEEGMLWRVDGKEIPVALTAGPIHDARGRVRGAVCILEDLTPLREVEHLRRQWISVVAHELRGAASIITLQSNVLRQQTGLTPRAAATVGHILSTAAQLNRMVGDLLDFSRLEAQQLRIEPKPLSLPAVLSGLLERMADSFDGRAVEVRAAGLLPDALADRERLEQVLGNLLSNAVKYGTAGTPIYVDLRQSGAELEVAVTNYGEGIPAEDLPRLFTRFFRSRNVQGRGISGLGLGLYITRGLVEAHGGRIWAECGEGRETVFTFTLPIAPPARE